MASQDRGISGHGGRLPRVPAFHQPRWAHARLSWLQPLSLLPNWDEAMGVPRDGGQRDPRSCLVTSQPCWHTRHGCLAKMLHKLLLTVTDKTLTASLHLAVAH